jgi:hypothetical protein
VRRRRRCFANHFAEHAIPSCDRASSCDERQRAMTAAAPRSRAFDRKRVRCEHPFECRPSWRDFHDGTSVHPLGR